MVTQRICGDGSSSDNRVHVFWRYMHTSRSHLGTFVGSGIASRHLTSAEYVAAAGKTACSVVSSRQHAAVLHGISLRPPTPSGLPLAFAPDESGLTLIAGPVYE
jgi:hypothetical protein